MLPLVAGAVPVTYNLTFETSGQSIWNTGSSYTLDQTNFIGAAWQDQTVSVGGIIGEEDTNLINPLRVTYDVAFAACTGLGFSASTCINGQTAQVFVPALGSRPSVRSCGTWDFGCQLKRAGDLTRRAAYDTAYSACRLGFSSTVCINGQSAKLPVIALGSAPPQYLEIDTRTGAVIAATTDGRVGLEVGIKIDSGSVDAKVSYAASLDIPDTTALTVGSTLSFNPNSLLAGNNMLNTTFSSMQLSVDAVMELSGSIDAEACLALAGCAAGGTQFDIDERAPILGFNQDGEGGIEILGLPPSALNLPVPDGFPASMSVGGYADVTLYLPQPDATGGLDNASNTLKAHGQDDLVDLIVDIDNIVTSAAGAPGLLGGDLPPISIGALDVATFSYDIINVGMGPTIDLVQDFELDPTLWVTLAFDHEVEILGNLVTEFTSMWDLLPDITFLSDATIVTPTFFLTASLLNQTALDFDLNFIIDLLQIEYEFPQLQEEGVIGIGNVLNKGIDLFQSPDLYSRLFDLQGFNALGGDAFTIAFGTQSSLPDTTVTRVIDNTIVLEEIPAEIPASGTLLLLAAGLLGIPGAARRRQRRAIHDAEVRLVA